MKPKSLFLNRPLYLPKVIKTGAEVSLIATMIIIILILFFTYTTSVVYEDNTSAGPAYVACDPGVCPTNIYTGEKRCPANDQTSIFYDPAYEVCNQEQFCTDPRTPYAVMLDGSTSTDGECPNNTICRCVTEASCSRNLLVTFQLKNGSPYVSAASYGSYYLLQQISPEIGLGAGYGTATLTNTSEEFCTFNPKYLTKITNACPIRDLSETVTQDMVNEDINTCLQGNPCTVGIMAYYVDNKDPLTFGSQNTDPSYYTLGCYVNKFTGDVIWEDTDNWYYPVWIEEVDAIKMLPVVKVTPET